MGGIGEGSVTSGDGGGVSRVRGCRCGGRRLMMGCRRS